MYLSDLRVYFKVELYSEKPEVGWRSTKIAEKLVDYANTTNFLSFNLYHHLHKHTKITILYNKLQYIVLQSCYKSTIKCESKVEYNLTS